MKPTTQQQLMIVLRDITQTYRDELSAARAVESLAKQNIALANIAAHIDSMRSLRSLLELATREICHTLSGTTAAVWLFAETAQQLDCACLYQRQDQRFQQADTAAL